MRSSYSYFQTQYVLMPPVLWMNRQYVNDHFSSHIAVLYNFRYALL